jgi:hypothetical protein
MTAVHLSHGIASLEKRGASVMARPQRDIHASVLDILRNLKGIEPLKQLFWSQLNYSRVNQSLSRRGWGDAAAQALADDPVLFAGGAEGDAFHVIYARLADDRLLRGLERPVVARMLRDHPYALFVFSNAGQSDWHFLNVKYDEKQDKRRIFRRITVGPYERLRTASERVALLDLASVSPNLFGLAPLDIQKRHDDAFDVEAVTRQFYGEYEAVFRTFEKDLAKQTKDQRWAHDYALQFLNRCMFLYFVQRKRWLGDDTEFLRTFWEAYRGAGQPRDTFFERWLKVLFFEAFNNRFHGGHRHFPKPIQDALAMAPFLNGGLFAENDLDRRPGFAIGDARFEQAVTFLERYNFTIAEDSPLDQEVAVDPEMIGKVYESLVNVSEEADERGDAGIFYTPRTEIDLMCRLALVDNLTNHLGERHKNLFYEAVFALEPEEKVAADAALAKARLWPAVNDRLRQLTVADLACGSGSFLVGMLHVLDDLAERANRALGATEAPFDRKRRIIGQSLYGVDVMEWACHVAELRLWLALIIDADFKCEELHCRKDPLLPHFTFKIRPGDSLVQEVGGINLGHRRGSHDIPKSVKDRLRRLQNAKVAFYNNVPASPEKVKREIEREEVSIFRDLLAERSGELDRQAKDLMRLQEAKRARQRNLLTGELEERSEQLTLEREAREKEIGRLLEDKDRLEATRRAMHAAKDVPFVWDIAFAEVMESGAGGFDIVIGNPPYVRTQSIADPRLSREEVTTEKNKAYKTKLARSVYQVWPQFFGYKAATDTASRKLDARSDLYVYFYFYGLSLLNEKGTFCFITSNSWLDVGYGADLQEFLLRHSHARLILDNQAKRTFANAAVNSVIALLAAPDEAAERGLDQTARFVMFKVPFEHVLSPVVFEEVEAAGDGHRKVTPEYRVVPVLQATLIGDGSEVPVQEDAGEATSETKATSDLIEASPYVGNKWGGKYLRAPDILHVLLDKGRDSLRPLVQFASIDTYLILRKKADQVLVLPVEEVPRRLRQYFKPFVRSPRYFECPWLSDSPHAILSCRPSDVKENADLKEFVRLAGDELRKEHGAPPSGASWYVVQQAPAPVLVQRRFGGRHLVFYNPGGFMSYDLYRLFPRTPCRNADLLLTGTMMSTTFWLFKELFGRTNLGQGALKVEGTDLAKMPICSPNLLAGATDCVRSLLKRPALSLAEELRAQDRREMDSIILESFGLTSGEREALYEAVHAVVDARLRKAGSV